LGGEHPEVATYLTWLSRALQHLGEVREAEAAAKEALDINRRKLGADHPRTKEAEGALGGALCGQQKWNEAEPLLVNYAKALAAKTGVEGDLAEVNQQITSKCRTRVGATGGAIRGRARMSR
jgi:hypothetical protein